MYIQYDTEIRLNDLDLVLSAAIYATLRPVGMKSNSMLPMWTEL